MNKFQQILMGLTSLFMTFEACQPEKETRPQDLYTGVYIVNEGNFTWQNSSISFYDFGTKTTIPDIYSSANEDMLGDVAYSLNYLNKKLFIVVNNSAKIVIIDPVTAIKSAVISGFNSPRFITKISDSIIWVSDLYTPKIWITNCIENKITGQINLPKTVENMVVFNQKVFATNWSKLSMQSINNNTVMVLSIPDKNLTDEIVVGTEPNSMVLDKYNQIWVLCSGGFSGAELPAIICIDAVTTQIKKTFFFPNKNFLPSKLCINDDADTLHYIYGGIYQMPVNSDFLPLYPLIEQNNRLFYGLAINPYNSEIYVSDALDYTQQGTVYRYNSKGDFIDSFKAGINPGYFCFRNY